MLSSVCPKLPMRHKATTVAFYEQLGFHRSGDLDYDEYLMVKRDGVEIHFFLFPGLQPQENYGQIYIRVNDIDSLYAEVKQSGLPVHPNGLLSAKPWGQKEFSMIDPDSNLLTFGEAVAL